MLKRQPQIPRPVHILNTYTHTLNTHAHTDYVHTRTAHHARTSTWIHNIHAPTHAHTRTHTHTHTDTHKHTHTLFKCSLLTGTARDTSTQQDQEHSASVGSQNISEYFYESIVSFETTIVRVGQVHEQWGISTNTCTHLHVQLVHCCLAESH